MQHRLIRLVRVDPVVSTRQTRPQSSEWGQSLIHEAYDSAAQLEKIAGRAFTRLVGKDASPQVVASNWDTVVW